MTAVDEVGPVDPEALAELLTDMFRSSGADEHDAAIVAGAILDAELREVRSQGLLRVPAYVSASLAGQLTSPTRVEVKKQRGGALVLDAGRGWPHVAALQAFELCMEQAGGSGTCFATITNTGHIGRLGYFVQEVAERGFIGIIMAGGGKGPGWVAPWGGTKPIWGTNPLAVGFPRHDGPPVVIDISTTQTSRGNVLMAQRLGLQLPAGFGLDAEGEVTTDPHQALPPHGTLTPLGGADAGHKGYGLALMIHVLAGVLAGHEARDEGGNFLGVIDIDAFIARDVYEAGLSELAENIKAVPRKEGVDEILIPGERSARTASRNRVRGLSFAEHQWAEITELAQRLGVRHPLLGSRP